MTDSQVVGKILALLGPDAEAHRHKVEREIRYGLGYVRRSSKERKASGYYGVVTEKHKKAAGKAAAAVRGLQAALRNPNLVRRDWTDEAAEYLDTNLSRLRPSYEADEHKPLGGIRVRAFNRSKHEAAKAADRVLQVCGLPLTYGKTGKFVKIAALIYGTEGADLRKVCGTVRRELRSE